MYFKLYESGLQRRDIWEGEDVECNNVKFKKFEKFDKKRILKFELVVNNLE